MGHTADFLVRFALPFLEGGEVHVGAPLGRQGLSSLWAEARAGFDESEAGRRLALLRHGVISELSPSSAPPRLAEDQGGLALLVALHDLLFLLHPRQERSAQHLGRRQQRVLDHAIRACEEARLDGSLAGGPDRGEALFHELAARHSLLCGLWTLGRNDTLVTFWAGQREFHGVEPPRRMLLWRRLRRVYEERWRVMMPAQLLGNDALRPGFLALLQASPLTDLLHPERIDPPLDLLRHGALLRIPELARAVSHRYLTLGLGRVGAPLGQALTRALVEHADHPGRPKRHADLIAALGFAARLRIYALLPLVMREPRLAPAWQGTPAREAIERPQAADGPGLDLLGLCALLFERYPELLPRGVDEPALARVLREDAQATREALGRSRMNHLEALCERALKRAPRSLLVM